MKKARLRTRRKIRLCSPIGGSKAVFALFYREEDFMGRGDVHCPGTIPFPANTAVCPARSRPSCVQNFIFNPRKYGQMAY